MYYVQHAVYVPHVSQDNYGRGGGRGVLPCEKVTPVPETCVSALLGCGSTCIKQGLEEVRSFRIPALCSPQSVTPSLQEVTTGFNHTLLPHLSPKSKRVISQKLKP